MPEVERRLREGQKSCCRLGKQPPPPPSPNAFQIALAVGLMADRVTLQRGTPDRGELLEVQDLLRAGQQLLLRGRRSGDWGTTQQTQQRGAETTNAGRDLGEAAMQQQQMESMYMHEGEAKPPLRSLSAYESGPPCSRGRSRRWGF